MKKTIIIITILTMLAGWGATTTTTTILNSKRIKEQSEMLAGQQRTIDSLLNRRMTVFDVGLSVNDNSKMTIYGKKSENLTVPAAKTYILKLDSVSIKQLNR